VILESLFSAGVWIVDELCVDELANEDTLIKGQATLFSLVCLSVASMIQFLAFSRS
jgi:hypothetical protein